MANKFFNAATTGDVLSLSIYGAIGPDMWGDGGITAQTVSDALKDPCKSVTVHLNSPGGSAFDGIAIYNLLKASAKPVSVIVEGMAASAASIIAMAGDTITMATGSVMMIHEGQAMAFGSADDMRKMADTLTTVTSGIADIYVARTGLPKADVLTMQNVETWMSAEDAVAKGFATSVSKTAAVKNEFKLDVFNNVPESLKVGVVKVEVPIVEEPVVEAQAKAEPGFEESARSAREFLSILAHQLEINKRK